MAPSSKYQQTNKSQLSFASSQDHVKQYIFNRMPDLHMHNTVKRISKKMKDMVENSLFGYRFLATAYDNGSGCTIEVNVRNKQVSSTQTKKTALLPAYAHWSINLDGKVLIGFKWSGIQHYDDKADPVLTMLSLGTMPLGSVICNIGHFILAVGGYSTNDVQVFDSAKFINGGMGFEFSTKLPSNLTGSTKMYYWHTVTKITNDKFVCIGGYMIGTHCQKQGVRDVFQGKLLGERKEIYWKKLASLQVPRTNHTSFRTNGKVSQLSRVKASDSFSFSLCICSRGLFYFDNCDFGTIPCNNSVEYIKYI